MIVEVLKPEKIVIGLSGGFASALAEILRRSSFPDRVAEFQSLLERGETNRHSYIGDEIALPHVRAVVFGTGMRSEIGKIAGLTQAIEAQESPLQKQLHATVLSIAGLAGGLRKVLGRRARSHARGDRALAGAAPPAGMLLYLQQRPPGEERLRLPRPRRSYGRGPRLPRREGGHPGDASASPREPLRVRAQEDERSRSAREAK